MDYLRHRFANLLDTDFITTKSITPHYKESLLELTGMGIPHRLKYSNLRPRGTPEARGKLQARVYRRLWSEISIHQSSHPTDTARTEKLSSRGTSRRNFQKGGEWVARACLRNMMCATMESNMYRARLGKFASWYGQVGIRVFSFRATLENTDRKSRPRHHILPRTRDP